jgi:hypothetical protein
MTLKRIKRGVLMKGIGIILWKISVALYLIANGVLGLTKNSGAGDFKIIFDRMGFTNNLFVICASVIALIAGIAILLEMFDVRLSFRDNLILIIAIIWAVYVVIEIVSWVTKGVGNDGFWYVLQKLAVHLIVLASLLVASRKFD